MILGSVKRLSGSHVTVKRGFGYIYLDVCITWVSIHYLSLTPCHPTYQRFT
jgi:hypothetical protein